MKPLVALLLSLSLAACFPNSAKKRTYAKVAEGAALASGIGILYFSNTGADCDSMRGIGEDTDGCRSNAKVLGTVGLSLVIAGLAGFIATVSTSPEDRPEAPANTLAPVPVTETTTLTPAASAAK